MTPLDAPARSGRSRGGARPWALLLLSGALFAQAEDEVRLAASLAAVRDGNPTLEILVDGIDAAIRLERWHPGRSLADEAQSRFPDSPLGPLWEGHCLFRMAEAEAASTRGGGGLIRATFSDSAVAYAKAAALGHDPYEAAYFEAEARYAASELDLALAAAERAALALPDAAAPKLLSARIQLARKDGEAAAKAAEAALEISPGESSGAALLLRGLVLARDRSGLMARAPGLLAAHARATELFKVLMASVPGILSVQDLRSIYEQAVRSTPEADRHFVHWYRAALEQDAGDLRSARLHAEAYVRAVPDLPQGHWRLGLVAIAEGRLAEARTELLAANALGGPLEPEYLQDAFRRLVGAHVLRAEYAQAIPIQELVISLGRLPSDTLDLGVLHRQSGDIGKARAVYGSLLAGEDVAAVERAVVWNYLGLLEFGQHRFEEARKAFEAALSVDSDQLDALENLGVLAARQGRAEEARARLEQVLARDATRHRARYHLLELDGAPLRTAQ